VTVLSRPTAILRALPQLGVCLLVLAALAACSRGEDHHIAVWDTDGRRLVTAFASQTREGYSCEDLQGNELPLTAPAVPTMPMQVFCRNPELNVDVHGTFEAHSAQVAIYSQSTLASNPGYDLAQRLAGSFRAMAGGDHVSVRFGPD